MQTVRQLLDQKGDTVWTMSKDAPVYDALELMARENIGALLVMDGDKPVGLFSERDHARKTDLQGRSAKSTRLKEVMTTPVLCAAPAMSVEEAMALVTDKRVRHLPVLEQDRLVGLISIGDLVKAVIDEQKFIIDQLAHYVTGDID